MLALLLVAALAAVALAFAVDDASNATVAVHHGKAAMQGGAKLLVNQVNAFRAKQGASDMVKVAWNYALQADLDKLAAKDPAALIVDVSTKSLMTTEPWASKYPGFGLVMHDACVQDTLDGCISHLIQLRVRQWYACCDYAKCSATQYSKFKSCCPLTPKGENCRNVNEYVQMLAGDWSSMACVVVAGTIQGTKPGKTHTYICYGNVNWPITDQTFQKGQHCSACPAGFATCSRQGLCVA